MNLSYIKQNNKTHTRNRFYTDSMRSHVILHEWIFFFFIYIFYSAFLNIHRSGVLMALAYGWCHMKLLPSRRVLCTPYNHAPLCHFMQRTSPRWMNKVLMNWTEWLSTAFALQAYLAQAQRFKKANVHMYGLGVQTHFLRNQEPNPSQIKVSHGLHIFLFAFCFVFKQ